LIDLHTHTNESDGSLAPGDLIGAATTAGLRHLAITDHDTFAGYERAREPARQAGIELIRGIELSTRDNGRPIHLLAYFPAELRGDGFTQWLGELARNRTERNERLAARLAELERPVSVAEAEALGRSITGRVHFARVMLRKGYVKSIPEAFRRYLGEDAPGYVEVDDPPVAEAIERVRRAGGLPVIAHPGRYQLANDQAFLKSLMTAGLGGVEAVHSDHDPFHAARYQKLAEDLGLIATGGSDFHGDVKPGIRLGHGDCGRMPIPETWIAAVHDALSRG
jgi:predicted metal-dependent phosphoesterase TrpH